MEVSAIHTRILTPPQDDLLAAIAASDFHPQEGDCIAVSSKVVSIWEGRCIPVDERTASQRDDLAKREATHWLPRKYVPYQRSLFTLANKMLIGGAGIDHSNAHGHLILWPTNPQNKARELLAWCRKTYAVETLSLIITDSRSTPLRRGAVGFALGWAGFDPLVDHTREHDLFGRLFSMEHTNLADALASSAVLVMGETDQCTPLAIIRNAPYLTRQQDDTLTHDVPYELPMHEDLFAPFLKNVPWEKGGK